MTITNYVTANDPIYYYNDKVFVLNKDTQYYGDYGSDSDYYYYFIPRYELGLEKDTSYVYVLSSNSDPISNSNGQLEKDTANGLFDVLTADTTGIITQAESDSDNFRRIEQSLQQTQEQQQNFQDTLLNPNISNETNTSIDSSLSYNNSNQNLTNHREGFFTRLSVMLSNLTLYNINQDTAVTIPVPFTNGSITLHSIDINNNVTGTFRTIVDLFWYFVFSFYLYKFINHVYISVTTGKILKDFNATTETISNHML